MAIDKGGAGDSRCGESTESFVCPHPVVLSTKRSESSGSGLFGVAAFMAQHRVRATIPL